MKQSGPVKSAGFVFTKDRQATIIIQFYTRPAGGAVSAAGRTLFVYVKMILNNSFMEQKHKINALASAS